MKQLSNDSEKPLTKDKLEEILSSSQINTLFFDLGYGIFSIYPKAYSTFGKFFDPTDIKGTRYSNFQEAAEDTKYILGRIGGQKLLRRWFKENRDYVGKRIFGDDYTKIRLMEDTIINNKMINEFASKDLMAYFLSFVSAEHDDKYGSNSRVVGKRIFSAYRMALERTYKIYT